MKEAIEQRMDFRSWEEKKLIEWQTRSLSAMLVNTAETTKEGRIELMKFVEGMSLTGTSSKGTSSSPGKTAKKKKIYRTVDGKEIPASEISNYTYDEIDHTEENERLRDAARRRNAGKNMMSLGFTQS